MSRREDAATATVGLTGVAGAAAAREHVIRRATKASGGKRPAAPRPPSTVLLRRMPGRGKLRAAYLGATAAGLLAGVPAVTGTAGLVRPHRVSKVTQEERVKAFLGTGVKGSAGALRQKATNVREPVPAKYRTGQAAAGLGAGALGAQVTHAALNRARVLHGGRSRAAATAVGATLAGALSLPATSAGIHHVSHGKYRATSTGVVRAKTARKPASSKATLVQRGRPAPRGFEKAAKTGYEHVDYKGRVARVYAAGAVPGPLGPINAARQAGRMVPKSQQRSATNTQYGLSQSGRYLGMTAGAYGAAALAHRSKKVAERSEHYKGKLDRGKAQVTARVPGYRGYQRLAGQARARLTPKPRPGGPSRTGRLVARAAAPLVRQKSAATLGALVGSSVLGSAGTLAATRISYDKERRARAAGTARHGTRMSKADAAPGLTRRQTRQQLKRKQRNIVLGTTSGTAGLAGLAALGGSVAPRVPAHVRSRLARTAAAGGITSAGLGGIGGLDSQRIARRDLVAQRKAYRLMPVDKAADPIKTYGDRGPLPKGLPREEKMRAYEARVAHHGGHKQAKWNRRANAAEVVRNVGLAGLTGAAGIGVIRRSPRVAALARKTPGLRRVADSPKAHGHGKTLAEGSGFVAGASELYGEYARHKRGSYSSSPGGAAQSALTRMRANTPGGAR